MADEVEKKQENKTQAIALSYDKEKEVVPRVIAKGTGFMADRILSIAAQNKVPVYKNKTLANMLIALDLDREIPPEMYHAVAEVLAFVYRIDKKMGEKRRK